MSAFCIVFQIQPAIGRMLRIFHTACLTIYFTTGLTQSTTSPSPFQITLHRLSCDFSVTFLTDLSPTLNGRHGNLNHLNMSRWFAVSETSPRQVVTCRWGVMSGHRRCNVIQDTTQHDQFSRSRMLGSQLVGNE